jgi:anion-transporting  ArsA/GET3 family ATPase
VAEFLSDLQSLFGGFRERASKVRDALMASEVAFVVVSSPDPMAVGEAMFFVDHLQKHRMNAEALVMNRVRQAEDLPTPSADRLAGILQSAGVEPSTELASGFAPRLA